MTSTILLFPGFANAKFFYLEDSGIISEKELSDAMECGFVRRFDHGGYGLTKRGRRVRLNLERRIAFSRRPGNIRQGSQKVYF